MGTGENVWQRRAGGENRGLGEGRVYILIVIVFEGLCAGERDFV